MPKHKWMLIFAVSLTSILIQAYGASFASSTNTNISGDEWAMFHHDASHSGTTTGITTNYAKPLWNYSTEGSIWSSPAVTGGYVFVGSKDGFIYSFNASNGRLVWAFPTGGQVDSSPAVAGSYVFVGSDDGWLYCMNITSGMPVWIEWVGWNAGWNSRSSPTVVNNHVYVGSGNHDVLCFNASDGSTIWTYRTTKAVLTSPAVSNGTLYVATDDFHVYALNASTGDELWHTHTGSTNSSPSIQDGYVYIGSYEGYVFCLNATTGTVLWRYQTGGSVTSSPAVAYGFVFVGSDDNYVYCINASNGQLIWRTQTGYWVSSSPAVADGNLYVGSEDYSIYCLNASTGTVKWSYQTGNYVDSSPAIVNDTLYVGSFDHNLYAFTLSNATNQTLSPKPAAAFAWTTVAFDTVAFVISAIVVFAVFRFAKSTRRNLGKPNFPGKKRWLIAHTNALCLLVILVVSASFFVSLGSSFLWAADEQTYSQMAVHMVKTGDYLTPTAYGDLGIWVGKPPLLMWLMSLSFQVFGVTNFAARFWIPVFAALSLMLVFYLGKKLYSLTVGFLSAIVLVTFTTFYTFATHAMTDVPLVFFVLASIYFFVLSEDAKKAGGYAVLSGLFFGLALMTKQTQALLIPLIAIVYLVLTKRNLRCLFTKQLGLFFGVAAVVFAPWLVYMTARFGADFWNSYFLYSFYGRAVSPIEGHFGSGLYYFNYLVTSETLLWVALLPFAVVGCIYRAVKRSRGDTLILVWMAIVLAVFTVVQTKIYYYILPAYPAFAIAISSLIYQIANRIQTLLQPKNV
jgi:outer membrane protein assembly factor BamB